jgi:hypothetical protein
MTLTSEAEVIRWFVGRRLNVLFDNQGYHSGTVLTYNEESKKFLIRYDDGETDEEDFRQFTSATWQWIDESYGRGEKIKKQVSTLMTILLAVIAVLQ